MFSKKKSSSTPKSLASNMRDNLSSPALSSVQDAPEEEEDVRHAFANAREDEQHGLEGLWDTLSRDKSASQGLAAMAQDLLEEEEGELSLAGSASRSQSVASHSRHGVPGANGRPASASPSMFRWGSGGRQRDTWQAEQAVRRRKQNERARQLANAWEVQQRQERAWKNRHAQLVEQNAAIRERQARVHAREMKPFVVCEEGPLRGRILYEPLEVTQEVMQERREMRKKITRCARQRKQDVEDYITHVSTTRAAPDFDADRKEFEKLVREAVESREIFDILLAEREAAQAEALRKQELVELRERRRERQAQAAAEEKKRRELVHNERLRASFGMTLIEQVGAVENMRGFGVRIVRPNQPTTVLIGSRREKIKVARLMKTLRGEAFPRIADTLVKKFFTVQVIPAEGQSKFVESADSFAGAYRLRIRYSDVRQVHAKKRSEDDGDDDLMDEGPKWTGPMRLKPIVLRITGSDGYLGVWTEQPLPAEEAGFQNNVLFPYRGVLETDAVPPAEDGVDDVIDIRGVEPSEAAEPVQDKYDFEFVKRATA